MQLFNTIKIVGVTLFMLGNVVLNAQCKGFTKKQCLPKLAPYTHNGQLTSAVFMPGESAEIEMTFNAGKSYRLIVASQEVIGNATFKVLDQTNKVIYQDTSSANMLSWDFSMKNTQPLIIQITVPPMETSNKIVPSGCVSLLIGFKE